MEEILDSAKDQQVPQCCRNCRNFDWDVDYFDTPYHYCTKNVWFPTKKQTCKKQKPVANSGGR